MSINVDNIRNIQFKSPEPEEVKESVQKGNDIRRDVNTLVKNRCPELEVIFQTSESHNNFDKEKIKEAVEKEGAKFLEFAESVFKQKEKPYFVQNAMSCPRFVKRIFTLTEDNELLLPKVNDMIHNFFTFHNIFSREKIGEHYDALVELYWTTYVTRNAKYINKIVEKAGVTETVAATIAIAVPKNLLDVDRDNYTIQRYTFMLLRNLYAMAKTSLKIGDNAALDDPKTIRKIIKYVFKHDDPDVVMRTILLEKSEFKNDLTDAQKAVWTTVDLVVLDWLESYDHAHQKTFLRDYGFKRLNSRGRRLNLQEHISQSDYPNILRTIEEVIQEKPKIRDCFK